MNVRRTVVSAARYRRTQQAARKLADAVRTQQALIEELERVLATRLADAKPTVAIAARIVAAKRKLVDLTAKAETAAWRVASYRVDHAAELRAMLANARTSRALCQGASWSARTHEFQHCVIRDM